MQLIMVANYTNVSRLKLSKIIAFVLLGVCILSLIPATYIAASGFGGYVSEKLIGRSGESDSNLVIGGAESSSLDIDVGSEATGGYPHTHMNPSEPAYRLNDILPLVMMAMLIFMMLKLVTSKKYTAESLVIAAVLIYVFYALLPGVRETITSLLGGG